MEYNALEEQRKGGEDVELKKVLAQLKTENGLTTQALAELSGVPRGTLNKLLNGETKDPRITTLQMLAEALNCPVEVLSMPERTEDAVDRVRELGQQYRNGEDFLRPARKRVPILGEIAAGEPIYAEEEYGEYADCGCGIQCDFALRVHGDSMIGARIMDGDIVFLRAQDDVDDGQIAAVVVDQTATLKRVYHIRGGIQLLSENPRYAPMIFTMKDCDSIRILGLAVAFQSRL